MKKCLTLTIIALIALIGLSVSTSAAEVSDEATIKSALTGTDTTITLTSDITLTTPLDVEREVTIDLNGHSITPADNFNSENNKYLDYVIGVHRHGDLTIKDSASNGKVSNAGKKLVVVKITVTGENDATYPAEFTLENGILEDTYAGTDGFAVISGNGYRHNTVVTINGGTVKSNNSHAIFQPQNGELTVTGGTIQGTTGIEIRSGQLTVTGGTIKATATTLTTAPNGTGATTIGAGIAIAQHTTGQEIKVYVEGGKVEGVSALYQSNVQGNATADIEKIDIAVSGGEFIAKDSDAVYSENIGSFIAGGTFSSDVEDAYISGDLEAVEDEDGNVYVGTLHSIKTEKIGNGTVKASKTEAVIGQKVTIEAIAAEGYKLKSITGVDGLEEVAEYAYEFTMPDKEVTIIVEFEKIPTEEDKTTTGEGTTGTESTPAEDKKDETPKTGSVDVVLFASAIVAVISVAGIVIVKKYTK